MRRKVLLPFILTMLSVLGSGCSSDPVPINYGTDVCDNCRMQIEDRGYGAELISPKGKLFRFDSGECLMQFLVKQPYAEEQARHVLVTDRSNPGDLTNAHAATYLISQQLPSPMGADLSAFASGDSARAFQSRYTGELLDWKELYLRFNKR
jgi:copper chaperone NosL